MNKVLFHVHTKYSIDSNLSLDRISKRCMDLNIDTIIVTNHNNLTVVSNIKIFNGVRFIFGSEINTADGEIIGLFLKENVHCGMNLQATIRQIKNQGGIVIIPHPFDPFRRNRINRSVLTANINDIDLIEVFNARNILDSSNKRALEFAKKYNKLQIVGSDAHTIFEIGNTYFEISDFRWVDDFLANLPFAKFYTKKAPLWSHGLSLLIRASNKMS